MEVLHKLFDAKRWMDRKLINVADQIRAWRSDFFCKINRRGATFIRYLRVSDGLNFWWYNPCKSSVEMVEIIGQPVC